MKSSFKTCTIAAFLLLLSVLCACGKETAKPVKTIITAVENTAAESPAVTAIDGDWFGWWNMYNATGEWSGHNGVCLDLCASIKDNELLLWDENFTRDYYLAKIILAEKNGGYYCAGGEMLNITLEKNACTISVSEDGALITITGGYYGTHKGRFDYRMYLRPWGAEWSGEDRPYNYDSWYLPLINGNAEMPDKIG